MVNKINIKATMPLSVLPMDTITFLIRASNLPGIEEMDLGQATPNQIVKYLRALDNYEIHIASKTNDDQVANIQEVLK